MPVQIVGGIEIKNDLPRRPLVRIQEQRDEQAFNRRRILADLVRPSDPGSAPAN